ncbi:conserved exported hypothetical protein [Candidatus Terasakiella magnetica]|uniref:LPS-assembly lipoprotein n=1 Tax=Candidatus Terasakiella magnetica TaxID=1867952 RepID=A0A1C3RGH2_9PROT|nr:LPS assembly lipoprotein LptE [Candidatus Terasakiella magnetica]SCA56365.1 conserved exported hypothetical protein [Candidatus Terasakiella magnetica]
MSLHKNHLIKLTCFLAIAISLGACGYQPLHGKRKTAQNIAMSQALSTVWIDEIEDREGQLLHNELLALFNTKGRPRNPKYRLAVYYSESSAGLGIGKDEFATRTNLIVNAKFNLTGNNKLSGTSQSVVSYNILTSPTGTEFARRDARLRAIKQVATDIHRRIAVHLLNAKPEEDK